MIRYGTANVYVTTGVIRQMPERHVHYDGDIIKPTKERDDEWRFQGRTSYR